MRNKIQRITPYLWFDKQAEEAAQFYVSVFNESKIGRITRYGKERYEIEGLSEGSVMTVEFQLEGQDFVALNGGPQYNFTPAISLCVNCETQEEVNYYWKMLSKGGDENAQVCGWLKDKYGVSWQVVPISLIEMINDPDTEKSERVMKAMLKMKKIDMDALKRAYDGK